MELTVSAGAEEARAHITGAWASGSEDHNDSHTCGGLPMNMLVNTLGQEMLQGYVSWMHCFLAQNPPSMGRARSLLSLANDRLIS